MALFDRFIFVDWSANSTPKTGKDSIWIAEVSGGSGITLSNPTTRTEATDSVLKSLRQAVAHKHRVLVGFDFAYSYPQAVLRCMAGNQGPGNFSALWKALCEKIQDDWGNVNDRYSFAAWANEHWLKEHYFWGFPTPAHAHAWLAGTKHDTRLPEFRLAESNAPEAQPTRKLAYPGSVGSQALLGMRRLHVLRNDPVLAGVSRVWPMETGFSLPVLPQGATLIVHAEIYPTPVLALAKAAGMAMSAQVAGMVNDAQQVWACAALALHEDNTGTLVKSVCETSILEGGASGSSSRGGVDSVVVRVDGMGLLVTCHAQLPGLPRGLPRECLCHAVCHAENDGF